MTKKEFYIDLLERVGWTFVQGFLAFWIVTGDVDGTTLAGGAVAGGISAAKVLLAVKLGSDNSGRLIPRLPGNGSPTPADEWLHEVNDHHDQP